MNKGLFSNNDVGVGTENRYSARLMGAWFNDKYRVMSMFNANNVNDMGFPGGGGRGRFGGGRNGLNANKMAGVNLNYEGDKLKLDGSVRWNHSDGDARSKSATENFVSTVGSFSNSLNQNYTRSNSWNGQMRLEWKPDSMTNIMFRPSASYSTSDGKSASQSASYNDDPYDYVTDPLNADDIALLAKDSLMVNSRNNGSITYNENKRLGGMLQYNRKLSTNGRNVTLRADVSYSETDSKSISTSNVHLYQVKNYWGADSTYQTNRYNLSPTKNWSYSLQTTYSEGFVRVRGTPARGQQRGRAVVKQLHAPHDAVPVALRLVADAVGVGAHANAVCAVVHRDFQSVTFAEHHGLGDVVFVWRRETSASADVLPVHADSRLDVGSLQKNRHPALAPLFGDIDVAAEACLAHEAAFGREEKRHLEVLLRPIFCHEWVVVKR